MIIKPTGSWTTPVHYVSPNGRKFNGWINTGAREIEKPFGAQRWGVVFPTGKTPNDKDIVHGWAEWVGPDMLLEKHLFDMCHEILHKRVFNGHVYVTGQLLFRRSLGKVKRVRKPVVKATRISDK